tara:strand:- start:25 stop:225 length:201 start_codon:yes stop_codon:yes gene_type:complete
MFIYLKLLTLFLNPKYSLVDYHDYHYLRESDDITVTRRSNNKILYIKVTKSKGKGAKIYHFRTKNY